MIETTVKSLDAFRVSDQYGRARVVDSVLELISRPPGVERHRDRSYCLTSPEARHPFRIVAHCDRYAIAFLDADRCKMACERRNLPKMLGEAQHFVLVDQERPVAKGACSQEKIAQRARCIPVDAHRHA